MYKFLKNYLVFCLICLQTAIPFIHAHAFGVDGFNAHIFHTHTVDLGSDPNKDLDSVSSTISALANVHVGQNEFVGVVTTVASGIKTSLGDNIADGIAAVAVFFTLVLLFFDAPAQFWPNSRLFFPPQHSVYSLHNSRAPPA